MTKNKSIFIISIIFFSIAILINFLQDDLTIPPALTNIPQKEITSKVHLSTKNLRNEKANGWTRNQDLIIFDHYPSVFPYPFSQFSIVLESRCGHIIGFSINQTLNFGSALFMCYDHTKKDSPIYKITETTLTEYVLPSFANTKNLQAIFNSNRIIIKYKAISDTQKAVYVRVPQFEFVGEFIMTSYNHHQTITYVYPLTQSNDSNFEYGSKRYTISTVGRYQIKGEQYDYSKGVAMLDHGRGTPPFKTMWIWGSICTILADGRLFGLNIGTGYKDEVQLATTDAIFIDGKMHKLGVVKIDFNNQDVMQGVWKIKSDFQPDKGISVSISLYFVPQRKIMNGKNYFLLKNDSMNICGLFVGTVNIGNFEIIQIIDIPGFMERNYAKW